MTDNRDLLSAKDVAVLLGVRRPNVYKWLARRGLQPARIDPLPVGRLYDREQVLAERDIWLKARDRARDERRSVSARARLGQ